MDKIFNEKFFDSLYCTEDEFSSAYDKIQFNDGIYIKLLFIEICEKLSDENFYKFYNSRNWYIGKQEDAMNNYIFDVYDIDDMGLTRAFHIAYYNLGTNKDSFGIIESMSDRFAGDNIVYKEIDKQTLYISIKNDESDYVEAKYHILKDGFIEYGWFLTEAKCNDDVVEMICKPILKHNIDNFKLPKTKQMLKTTTFGKIITKLFARFAKNTYLCSR